MIAKRIFDLCVVIPGIAILAPLLLLLAILVKASSRGPIFFLHTRVGRHGQQFNLIKYRTMQNDAESTGLEITANDDPRITSIGRRLRKYKLDELPQLFNVLKGDMSLVGPRPEVPRYVRHYPADVKQRVLSLRPGLTDYAAIEFRNEGELLARAADPEALYVKKILPIKLKLYDRYVAERSFWVDLGLILRTLRVVVTD